MNEDCTLNDNSREYKGLDRLEARKLIVERLKQEGYLIKIEDITHAVGVHERCNEVVEPLIKLQWFVKWKNLQDLQ